MKSKPKSKLKAKQRRNVFSAYRSVFAGKKPGSLDKNGVYSLVLEDWSMCESRVSGCSIEQVTTIIQDLLEKGVFVSEERASEEFPSLFRSKSQQDCSGTIHGSNTSVDVLSSAQKSQKRKRQDGSSDLIARSKDTDQPLRLPYEVQHHILPKVQQLLEESCFNYFQRRLPFILTSKKWDCASAGELTAWLRILRRHAPRCLDSEGQALLEKISPTVARLRHTAVHRLILTPKELKELIHCARQLSEILQDGERSLTLRNLHESIDEQLKIMEEKTESLKRDMHNRRLDIQWRRSALDKEETELPQYEKQQNADILSAIVGALTGSNIVPLTPSSMVIEAGNETVRECSGSLLQACDVQVHDDDIESDEDRLLSELG